MKIDFLHITITVLSISVTNNCGNQLTKTYLGSWLGWVPFVVDTLVQSASGDSLWWGYRGTPVCSTWGEEANKRDRKHWGPTAPVQVSAQWSDNLPTSLTSCFSFSVLVVKSRTFKLSHVSNPFYGLLGQGLAESWSCSGWIQCWVLPAPAFQSTRIITGCLKAQWKPHFLKTLPIPNSLLLGPTRYHRGSQKRPHI